MTAVATGAAARRTLRQTPAGLPVDRYRVIFADTDAMGLVYHARFLEFAERSRNAALERAGVALKDLVEKHGVGLVVQQTSMEFISPVVVDEELELSSCITRRKMSRTWWRTVVRVDGRTRAVVEVATVCVNLRSRRPALPPDNLSDVLKRVPVLSP